MQTLTPSKAYSDGSVEFCSVVSQVHYSRGRKIRICPYRPRVCCGQVWEDVFVMTLDHNSDSIDNKIPPLGNIGSDASSSGLGASRGGCSYSSTNDDDATLAAKHSTSGNHTCLYKGTMWSDKQSFRHAISALSSNQQHCQREFQI